MKNFNLLVCLAVLFLMFGCVDPDEDENNPDLRVVNNFEDYKISEVIVNNQVFRTAEEYLLPGRRTKYMNVVPGKSILLSYRWKNVSEASDSGEFGTLTAVGDYPELLMNETYTLTYSGDKEEPTIHLAQP
jgi:hypothetical protein